MYHFELVHIPGERHGPDGLSRRPVQPGDTPEPDDEQAFDDWIDNLHGFLHLVNPPAVSEQKKGNPEQREVTVLAQSNGTAAGLTAVEALPYEVFPQSPKAVELEERIWKVGPWLQNLARPDGFSDGEYKGFMKFAVHFFVGVDGELWRKDTDGQHRKFIPPARRPRILVEFHDYIGH